MRPVFAFSASAAAFVAVVALVRLGFAEPPVHRGDGAAAPVSASALRTAVLTLPGGIVDWSREGLESPAAYPSCLVRRLGPGASQCHLKLADVLAGYLVSGDFDAVLVDGWPDNGSCVLAEQIRDFATDIPGVRQAGIAVLAGAARPAADRCGLVREPFVGLLQESEPASFAARVRDLLARREGRAPRQPRPEVSRSWPVVARSSDGPVAVFGVSAVPEAGPRRLTSLADPREFRFPHVVGDLRGQRVEQGEKASAWQEVFIPPVNVGGCLAPFTTECRTVFTTTALGLRPEILHVSTQSTPALAPLLSAEASKPLSSSELHILVARVLAGRDDDGDGIFTAAFGGVDLSTAAVVGASPIAGDPARPVIAYVGALDGMIHAVCVEVAGPCDKQGRELWAFLPRAQLPLVRDNRQRIDGSPTVADVFGDVDGDGLAGWHTILTVHVGGRAGHGTVVALDVTDPARPTVAWERGAAVGPATLGEGRRTVMGPVVVDRGVRFATFAQGRNAGTGDACTVVAAFDTITGAKLWTWSDAAAYRTGDKIACRRDRVPGGLAAIDSSGERATITNVFASTAAGLVFRLEATRPAASDARPVFSFSQGAGSALQPTVYADTATGRTMIVAVSSADDSPPAQERDPQGSAAIVVGFPANTTGTLDETTVADAGGFSLALAGRRVMTSPIVTGTELWVASDGKTGAVGDASFLERYDLRTPTAPRRIGAAIDLDSALTMPGYWRGAAVIYGAGSLRKELLTDFNEGGLSVEQASGFQRTSRIVWLRD